MTVLHPCQNCHRKADCSIRKKTLAGLKGLSITKATLRCLLPQKDFPAGTIVDVKAFELVPGKQFDDGYRPSPITRRGIVRGWAERKALVVLDKDQEITQPDAGPIGHLRVSSEKLIATGLPPVELCSCGISQARCDAGDYPSVRGGTFVCGREQE